jgi:hypothetical protein
MGKILKLLQRIRQIHALEHATIHILSWRYPQTRIVGRSTDSGFYIYGDVETEALAAAASEALARLQRGEKELAIHPQCGTNLATAGVLAGLSAFLALVGRPRKRWTRLPEAITLATLAVLLSQPLGLLVQRYITTSPQVSDITIKEIKRFDLGTVRVHKVEVCST